MARRNRKHPLEPLPEPKELTLEERSDVLTFLRDIDTRMNAGSDVGLDDAEAKRVIYATANQLHQRSRKQQRKL